MKCTGSRPRARRLTYPSSSRQNSPTYNSDAEICHLSHHHTYVEHWHLCCVFPMDGLSSAASVIAVVQLTGFLVKLCGGFIQKVRDARDEIF